MKAKLLIAFLTCLIVFDNCSVNGQSSEEILSKKYYKKASFNNFNSAISNPDKARQIKIKKEITSFPENLSVLVNLEYLEIIISDNFDLKSLFNELSKLNNFKVLFIKTNSTTILPENIGNLKYLKHLGLSCSNMNILPNSIGELYNLETLLFYNSKLTDLPPSFIKLLNLKYVDFHNCNFSKFPIQLTYLTKMQEIYLQNNSITEIPTEITNLNNLRLLNLTANQIKTLPIELFGMNCLTWPLLDKNLLTTELSNKVEKMRTDNQRNYGKNNCK